MIDLSLFDLLPADSAASMKSQIAEVIRSGKHIHSEYEREGKIIAQNIHPVFGRKGEISRIAIFARDITVRKWVEEVTEQLGRRNELILEAAGEGIYGLDTQGKTTFVNPAAARMLGYKQEDLIGQRHHELVHHSKPDGRPYPHEQCPIYTAFKDGVIRTSVDDEVFWRKDGTHFPVEYTSNPIIEDGRILGAVVTFRDITERKRVEKALSQSEEKYRSMFEATTSLIVSVDKEGLIIDCNDRIQQILDYAPHEIIGQNLVDFVHPDEQTKVQECLKEVLTKGFDYNNHYRMVRKDGSLIDVSMNAAAVRDTHGAYVRTICMIDDMTERL
jgi:PAS domain S-box-containing protein